MQAWEQKARADIVEAGATMYNRGMAAGNDGNISARLPDGTILITPAGICKGFMTPEVLLKITPDGEVLEGESIPSSETKMHLAVYRKRPDIHAAVHAHPIMACTFAVARMPIDRISMPEAIFWLKKIGMAPYATPSSPGVHEGVEALVDECDAILLSNHGALTIGHDVPQAYRKIEVLEHYCTIAFHARQLKEEVYLTDEQVAEVLAQRRKLLGEGS